MAVINRIAEFHDDIKAWRRDIHAHPETAFEELRTADFVAEKLAEDQHAVIRPVMPVQRGNVRIASLDVINAVLYLAENGCCREAASLSWVQEPGRVEQGGKLGRARARAADHG